MTGAAKMAVLANARGRGGEARGAYGEMRGANNEMRGGNYGGMRNESTSMEAMGYFPPMWQEPEDRRRDSRGRFVRSEMNTSENMRSEGRYRGEREERDPMDRAPMQIGFRYEEDMGRYRSDAGYPRMNESEHRRSPMDKGHAQGKGMGKLDKQTADEWVNNMTTADGYKGKRWSQEQAKQVMMQQGIDCDPMEFYVAINMMFSDYGKIAEEMGIDNVDFYAKMAKAFLKDPDAVQDKLMAYYSTIAK